MDNPDLGWTQWTPADIDRTAAHTIAAKQAALSALKAVPAELRTFDNTIGALERSGDSTADIQQTLQLLTNVHPDGALRDSAQAAHDRMDAANIAMAHDRGIWNAVQQWVATGELEKMSGPDRLLADHTIRDLKRVGFSLLEERFSELRAKRTELQKLESEFERTINEYSDHIELPLERLGGMSPSYVAGLRRTPQGNAIISLQYPDIIPFMELAQDDDARRELASKNLRKGGSENLTRLARMVSLRAEIAGILGYPTHADFVEEVRMSKTATAVCDFLERIIARLKPAAGVQLRELVKFKKEILALEHPAPIHFHEVAYWSYRLRKERFGVDGEEIKAYFPLARVMEGMMGIYQELLGVRFTRVSDGQVWHPDVTYFAMSDTATGRTLGHFFMDLYPRAGKYGHAAVFPIRLARADAPEGVVALVCNFPKPTPENPGLLGYLEVETLLHEFGHVMHALLSGGRWQSQNGFGVPLDFVEALSQIFEYWALEPAALARLSGHWQTGEPLPQSLLDRILAARRELEAMQYLNQAVRSLYDLRMHSSAPGAPVAAEHLAAMYRDMKLEHEHIDLPDDAIWAAGWGHMAEYDAGYYGYLWSKVYAADMFTAFASNPLSAEIGMRYRTEVLQPGASRPELDLVRAFLGREPSEAAFLAELGIA